MRPAVAHILQRIQEATGAEMTIAPELEKHLPDLGYIEQGKKGNYAWQLMEIVAKREIANGRWEKTAAGYRLCGVSTVPTGKGPVITGPAKATADFATHHPLGLDEKLHVRVTVIEKGPKVSNALPRLVEATGLRFTLADNLSHHDPILGYSLPKDTRAYSIMEIIAGANLDNGRWEKTEDGYRLEGGSPTPLPPRKFNWFWPALAVAVMCTVVGGFVLYRRRGKKAATKPSSA